MPIVYNMRTTGQRPGLRPVTYRPTAAYGRPTPRANVIHKYAPGPSPAQYKLATRPTKWPAKGLPQARQRPSTTVLPQYGQKPASGLSKAAQRQSKLITGFPIMGLPEACKKHALGLPQACKRPATGLRQAWNMPEIGLSQA